MGIKKPITIELVNTDADELISSNDEDPSICQVTGNSIVNPPAIIEELKMRIEKAAKTSPAAQLRRIIRNTDPNLN